MTEGASEFMRVDVRWADVEALPLQFVNQMAIQLGTPVGDGPRPDGIHLTFGQTTPPLLTGTPEDVQRQFEELQTVPIRPVGRFILSRDRAEELLQILAQSLSQFDSVTGGTPHARA